MALSFQCPSCDAQYTVADSMAGQTARCKCGVMVAIQKAARPRPTTGQSAPARPATTRQASAQAASSQAGIGVTCSGCQKKRTVPREMAGRKGRCDCGTVIQIPQIRTPAAPAPARRAPATPAPATPAPSPFAPTPSSGPDTSLLDELTDDDWQADVTLEPVVAAPQKRSDQDVLSQYSKSSSV